MTVWAWIGIGAASFLVLFALVGLALARILGAVGRQVSELYETEAWAQAPLTRTLEDEAPEPSVTEDEGGAAADRSPSVGIPAPREIDGALEYAHRDITAERSEPGADFENRCSIH